MSSNFNVADKICTAERLFSTLIVSPLRSTMGNDRLSSSSFIYVNREIADDMIELLHEFSHRHPLRLRITNIM